MRRKGGKDREGEKDAGEGEGEQEGEGTPRQELQCFL